MSGPIARRAGPDPRWNADALARVGAAMALLASGVSTSFFVGENSLERGASLDPAWVIACTACIATGAGLAELARRRRGLRAWLAALVVLVLLPASFFLGKLFGDAPWRPTVVVGFGALGALVRRDQAVSAGCWTGLMCAALAHALETSAMTFALLGATGAGSSAGLALSHSWSTLQRFVRRRAARATRPVRIVSARELSTHMLAGFLVTVAAGLLVHYGRNEYQRRLDFSARERDRSDSGERKPRRGAVLPRYMSEISLSRRVVQPTDDIVAVVTLRDEASGEPIVDGRTLYFPVANLDSFDGDRMQAGQDFDTRVVRDEDDGLDDGWIDLRRRRGLDPMVVANVRQEASATTRGGLTAVLRLEPLQAVRTSELTCLEGVALLVPATGADTIEYELRSAPHPVSPVDGVTSLRPRDGRYLALPPRSAALDAIVRWAEETARGSATDSQRMSAIVQRLQGFEYSEEDLPDEGVAGLARMLELRAGYCAPITAACVIMLRSQGIPARGVVGFMGSEFDADTGEYFLRQRHGHAWVEAHFGGIGWMRLEPTPSSGRPGETPGGTGDPFTAWSGGLMDDFELLASDFGRSSAERVVSRLVQAPQALFAAARERRVSALAVIAVLALVSVYVLAGLARRAARVARERFTAEGRALAFEQRLIDELVEHGARAEDSSTLREIGASAEARLESGLSAKLRAGIAALYAARFGGEELDGDARQSLEALLDELRAWRKLRRAQAA